MTTVIVLAGLNGGTGKTTICHYLGGALANDGLKVLLVDNDASHGLTSLLAAADEHEYRSSGNKESVRLKDEVIRSRYANLFRIRACSELNELARIPIRERQAWGNVEMYFYDRFREFEIILIDCASGNGRRARGCILMADLVLIPTRAEPSGVRGVRRTIRWINWTLAAARGTMIESRVVVNLRPARSLDTTYHESLLREDFGKDVLPMTIPTLEALKRPARADKEGRMVRSNSRHKDPMGVMSSLLPVYMKHSSSFALPTPLPAPRIDESTTGESAFETYPLA
ncbi:ParA family protein [Singulisphaera sp. PoT]|uniref:ParA family protein n=1 Tax=Singulisphaera sp. PoT TaxID=3411797 RepID=UPI003BF5DCF9